MFNSEVRYKLGWLALPSCPIPSWIIMLLALAALLALAIPAAQAAGCTAFDVRFGNPDENGISKAIGSYYVMVPDSNFLSGVHKIYIDDKCDVPPTISKYERDYLSFSLPSSAFAKKGKKAMEICELNMDQPVAAVRRVTGSDLRYTHFYCEVGKREGPKRQRREFLTRVGLYEDAEGALARCKETRKGMPNHSRANHVEPTKWKGHWDCYRVWKVSKSYLKRVGA